jgi:hypothetical protein
VNLERVTFGFFIFLALTLNVVFVMGDIDNVEHHNVWVLTIAILVNLVAMGLKMGDRTQVGAILLATSLVANLLLITARIVWIVAEDELAIGPGPASMVNIVSLAIGALVANLLSAVLLIGDTLMSRR